RPCSWAQEAEAGHVGLILMAKAGYDPKAALGVWERMERKEKGGLPDFLSTYPGSETRIQQLKAWMPEALQYYHPIDRLVEPLPSVQGLESATSKAERELLKRIQAIDQRVKDKRRQTGGEEERGNRPRMCRA